MEFWTTEKSVMPKKFIDFFPTHLLFFSLAPFQVTLLPTHNYNTLLSPKIMYIMIIYNTYQLSVECQNDDQNCGWKIDIKNIDLIQNIWSLSIGVHVPLLAIFIILHYYSLMQYIYIHIGKVKLFHHCIHNLNR